MASLNSLNYVEEGDVSNVLAAPLLRAETAVWPMAFGSTSELVLVQRKMMVIFMHNCFDKYVMQTFSEICD